MIHLLVIHQSIPTNAYILILSNSIANQKVSKKPIRTLNRKQIRVKKLQEHNQQVKDERIQRSLLRLECKKIAAIQVKAKIQTLNTNGSKLKKKPSASLLRSISKANHNLSHAVEQFKIESYKLYHYQ